MSSTPQNSPDPDEYELSRGEGAALSALLRADRLGYVQDYHAARADSLP